MNTGFLKSHLPSFKIYTFEEIESTNTFAKTLTDDFALVIASSQTNGRGRLGREFISPKSTGIYMSLLVKVSDLYQNVPFITTAAAASVHKAIYEVSNIPTSIKWVNDIYKDGKKVAGILCESSDSKRAVIGIGINLLPNNLPIVATSLFEKDLPFSKEELIVSITNNFISIINSLPNTDFLNYYKAHSMVLGKNITCFLPQETFTGKAIDIDPWGALIVESDNGLRTLSTGEISIRLTD